MVYHLILFTEFQDDLEFAFSAGYSYLAVLMLLLLINVMSMVSTIVR